MHDLPPLTALGGTAPQIDTHGGVTCTEVPGVALASFAARLGSEKAAKSVLKTQLGADVPEVGQSTNGSLTALWTGPDQWLIEADFETHEDFPQSLAKAAKGVASVTEQTDAWTRFDLSGPGVLAVLELLCAADTRAMAQGAVVRSAIHHLGCVIHRRGVDHFALYGPRASAGSLHHAVVTAMHAAL